MWALSLLFSAFAMISCKKDKKDEKDQTNTPAPQASIVITSPTTNSIFDFGEEIHIHATITAPFEMHGYELEIIRLSDNAVLWSTDAHAHATSYSIHEHWTNDVMDHTDVKLKITAELDHSGGISVGEVQFHCHPEGGH